MSNVDGLLRYLKAAAGFAETDGGFVSLRKDAVRGIIATIEQQWAEIELWKTAAEEYIRQQAEQTHADTRRRADAAGAGGGG